MAQIASYSMPLIGHPDDSPTSRALKGLKKSLLSQLTTGRTAEQEQPLREFKIKLVTNLTFPSGLNSKADLIQELDFKQLRSEMRVLRKKHQELLKSINERSSPVYQLTVRLVKRTNYLLQLVNNRQADGVVSLFLGFIRKGVELQQIVLVSALLKLGGQLLIKCKAYNQALIFYSDLRILSQHAQVAKLAIAGLLGMGECFIKLHKHVLAKKVYKRVLMLAWNEKGDSQYQLQGYKGLSLAYYENFQLQASRYFHIRETYSIREENGSIAKVIGQSFLKRQKAAMPKYSGLTYDIVRQLLVLRTDLQQLSEQKEQILYLIQQNPIFADEIPTPRKGRDQNYYIEAQKRALSKSVTGLSPSDRQYVRSLSQSRRNMSKPLAKNWWQKMVTEASKRKSQSIRQQVTLKAGPVRKMELHSLQQLLKAFIETLQLMVS